MLLSIANGCLHGYCFFQPQNGWPVGQHLSNKGAETHPTGVSDQSLVAMVVDDPTAFQLNNKT